MKIERLFNVLILSGAAVGLAACSDDGGSGGAGAAGTPGTTSGNAGSSGGEGGSGGTLISGSGGEGGNGGGGGATAGSGGGGATAGSGEGGASVAAGSGGGGASTLDCSSEPDPNDACGCPCCWMGGGCLNNEPCCAGFCEAGNDGEGCCGG